MKTRFSLLFQLCKGKALPNGEVPIYLKVAVGEEKFELSTEQYVIPGKWNAAAQKVSGVTEEARSINAY